MQPCDESIARSTHMETVKFFIVRSFICTCYLPVSFIRPWTVGSGPLQSMLGMLIMDVFNKVQFPRLHSCRWIRPEKEFIRDLKKPSCMAPKVVSHKTDRLLEMITYVMTDLEGRFPVWSDKTQSISIL